MAPPRARKSGSATMSSGDDHKVYEMIVGYLEVQAERANARQQDSEGEDEDAERNLDLRPFLKKLSIMEAVNFCKETDFKFKRSKSAAIAKMVEKAFSQIRSEQDSAWAEAAGGDLDSDFEGVDLDNMMEVKDTNQQNKSVVSLWNVQPAQVPTSGTATPSTPTAAATPSATTGASTMVEKTEDKKASKKRERSSKDEKSSSKRQKGMFKQRIS